MPASGVGISLYNTPGPLVQLNALALGPVVAASPITISSRTSRCISISRCRVFSRREPEE